MMTKRRGGKRWLLDDELVEHMQRLQHEPEPRLEGYRKIWARLRNGGIRTSRGRVLRLMRRARVPPAQRSHEEDASALELTDQTKAYPDVLTTDHTAKYPVN